MVILSLPVSEDLQCEIKNIVYIKGLALDFILPMVPRSYSALFFMSDAAGTLSFTFGHTENKLQKGKVYIAGLGFMPSLLKLTGNVEFFTVILNPFATGRILGDKTRMMTNQIACISDVCSFAKVLNEELWENGKQIKQQQDLMENLIRHSKQPPIPAFVLNAFQQINLEKGCLEVELLADRVFTCSRNLLRGFTDHIGVSPKQYASMLRFNALLKEYFYNTERTLDEILWSYQYYDHSHLNKDFKRFLGSPPRLISRQDQTINNLIL